MIKHIAVLITLMLTLTVSTASGMTVSGGGDTVIRTETVYDFPSIAAQDVGYQNVGVTGAELGDYCLLSTGTSTGSVVAIQCKIVGTNMARIMVVNNSAAPVDLASMTYYLKVIKR